MGLFSADKKRGLKKRLSCSAVVAAAGVSQRMKGEDKLFTEIGGAPVLAHSLTALQRCAYIDEIIVVAREDSIEPVGELCVKYGVTKATAVMAGGQTRLESVLIGALAASKKAKLIAIHDGARPCVDQNTIESAIAAAAEHHAAAPGIPVRSTLKRVKDGIVRETVDRESLFEIQTPQVFEAHLIKAALTNAVRKSLDVTDDCMAVEFIGAPVFITGGSAENIKITMAEDVKIAEAILMSRAADTRSDETSGAER